MTTCLHALGCHAVVQSNRERGVRRGKCRSELGTAVVTLRLLSLAGSDRGEHGARRITG